MKEEIPSPPPENARPLTEKEIEHIKTICKKYWLTDNITNIHNAKGNWHYLFACIDEDEKLVGFIPYGKVIYPDSPCKEYMEFHIPYDESRYTDPKIISEILEIRERVRLTLERYGKR